MKRFIPTLTFCLATVLGAAPAAAEQEDYTGLPIIGDEALPMTSEVQPDTDVSGYDGLPVTRQLPPTFVSSEADSREGYDGLPLSSPYTGEQWAYEY